MGVVIRRWVWLETIGVVSGCFPHITYISLLHLYLFFFAAVIIIIRVKFRKDTKNMSMMLECIIIVT